MNYNGKNIVIIIYFLKNDNKLNTYINLYHKYKTLYMILPLFIN